MITPVDIEEHRNLDDYASYAHLAGAVAQLRAEASTLAPLLAGRTVWMVNSTAQGGGVAEMLPMVVTIMRELGVDARWLVMGTEEQAFFSLTKRIHNMIHGAGEPALSSDELAVYRKVSEEVAAELASWVAPQDVLVVHDPQPLGAGAVVKRQTGVIAVWRCHIGLDRTTPTTESAWEFLEPWARAYDHTVFSAAEYIPPFLAGAASIIHPAIDPLSHKNRELSPHKLVGILCNAGLIKERHPVLTPPWARPAMRLQPDGSFRRACDGDGLGLLYRPIVAQVSRWDRLKGWRPLLEGFLALRRSGGGAARDAGPGRRRLRIMRLVLAGPDPAAIQDDPEGREVLGELCGLYRSLDVEEQASVTLVTLPMESLKENALMVNALQRCATVVAQNSLQEGFGLTATEAMWKRVPVLGSSACGLRQQIRDDIDGRITADPADGVEVAARLGEMLADPVERDRWGRNAQRRVYGEFLVFAQVAVWLRRLAEQVDHGRGAAAVG